MSTTHISALFPPEDLERAVNDGLVSVQTHPDFPLRIYNYTPAAQYSRAWNAVTTQCRGLIVNDDDVVVARPFPKFFNYGEDDQYDGFPEGDPIVSEKMDGSLGIIYSYEDASYVATRGSFTSDQAIWATNHLHATFPYFYQPRDITTLVEIIYPQNRVVVDYGSQEGLWLLGAIHNPTGMDIAANKIDWWDGPVAETYPYFAGDVDNIAREVRGEVGHDTWGDGEGVVMCWPQHQAPSFRLKVKHPRYIELHRIVTGLSTRTVHEALANGTFDDLIANVPDEFHPWVREVSFNLIHEFTYILKEAERDLYSARQAAGDDYTRRDLAEQIQKISKLPGLCFALEDGKDVTGRIWQMVRPERTTAMILEA